MSLALNGSTVLQCFDRNNAVEIRNRIMFDFYPGLSHMIFNVYLPHMYCICKEHALTVLQYSMGALTNSGVQSKTNQLLVHTMYLHG